MQMADNEKSNQMADKANLMQMAAMSATCALSWHINNMIKDYWDERLLTETIYIMENFRVGVSQNIYLFIHYCFI